MKNEDVYGQLADHLSKLPMSLPLSPEMVEILRANLTEKEAEVALALPNNVIPLGFVGINHIQDIPGISEDVIEEALESLSRKGVIMSGKTENGKKGYALWQNGFGFPQVFHWKGEDTPHARKMAELIRGHRRSARISGKALDFTETKPHRYIPVNRSIEVAKQGVYSMHMMEEVIGGARRFAVAHCSCRVSQTMLGRGCDHPTEVCLKFNEMAEFLIEKGFAREVTKDEAMAIIRQSEEAGLVHFVDNTEGDIQHNCNCCGCVCWNVGPIKRRRVPRDDIMATYFLRKTDTDECVGCGECIDICPVDAVKMEDDAPRVDKEWCIGCGVCSKKCPNDAIRMVIRPDRTGKLPAGTFKELHEIIMEEKGIEKS